MRQAYDYWQDQPGKRRSFSTRLRPFLTGQHRGPTSPPASKQHFSSVRRVASHFPPWPEGQCLAPSADGRGPSRAKNAPRRRGWNFSRPRAKNGGPPAKAVRAWQRGHTPRPRPKIQPGNRGSRRFRASPAEGRRLSRVTRSSTSVGTSERAVTRKSPGLVATSIAYENSPSY